MKPLRFILTTILIIRSTPGIIPPGATAIGDITTTGIRGITAPGIITTLGTTIPGTGIHGIVPGIMIPGITGRITITTTIPIIIPTTITEDITAGHPAVLQG